MNDLPKFRIKPRQQVIHFISSVLTNPGGHSCFYKLVEYPDGHYRTMFNSDFFFIAEGRSAPSKSQWSTLKKKLKRKDHTIFIFKDCGVIECDGFSGECYYIDFGYFAD
jgi:hypothetical protein